MIAVIAEKPSVGKDIARVMGATERHEGYYSGNGYMVTWAFGHLVALGMPQDYGYGRLTASDLPVIPDNFILTPKKAKTSTGYAVDTGVSKQLKVIRSLFEKCDQIVVATDAGREGELIFRYIYYYLGVQKPFSRLWISSLTDSAIRTGFENLRPGAEYDDLFNAATARSKADWLIGINASQALAYATHVYNNSLGRVQTPTLAMISRRYRENKEFTITPFYQVKIGAENKGMTAAFVLTDRLFKKEAAEELYTEFKKEKEIQILKIETRKKNEAAPLLYDLTSLQRDANRLHNFGAADTLKISQKLYERKFISYPRTGSRYLTDDVFLEIPSLLTKLAALADFKEMVSLLDADNLNRASVNPSKVTDHHALITTGIAPVDLSKDEKIIYNLIASRMVEAFMPTCIKEVTKAEGKCMELIFSSQIVTVIESGWRKVLGREEEKNEEDDNLCQEINPLSGVGEGDTLQISGVTLLSRKTTPPPLFTEGTLLSAMETAGKELESEEQRERLKDLGLGTPATRASIIETLFKREYIAKKGKSLIPTEKGLYVYDAVKEMQIADIEMTGSWEKTLYDIERGENQYESFMQAISVHTRNITSEILSISIPSTAAGGTLCPKCKTGSVHVRAKTAKCDNKECDFILFRSVAGKQLTDTHLQDLLSLQKTKLIKGFHSKKKDSIFDAKLYLDANFQLQMEFPPRKNNPPSKKIK